MARGEKPDYLFLVKLSPNTEMHAPVCGDYHTTRFT